MINIPIIGRENVGKIVPHKGDMLLLDNIISFSEDQLAAEAVLSSSSPFSRGHHTPSYVAFELIAQAISAYSYLKGLRNGERPLIGFVLRVSDFSFSRPYFSEDECARIYIEEDCAVDESLYSFTGRVATGEDTVASGRLLVMCSRADVLYSEH